MESLASGTPLVATPAGGIGAVVGHGRTGFLVPERDAAALADALAGLLADSALRARVGQAARQEVCARYTWERFAQRLEEIFDVAVERRGTGAEAGGTRLMLVMVARGVAHRLSAGRAAGPAADRGPPRPGRAARRGTGVSGGHAERRAVLDAGVAARSVRRLHLRPASGHVVGPVRRPRCSGPASTCAWARRRLRPGWTALIPVVIVVMGLWLYFPPAEWVLGGRDPGVYTNEGVRIAQTGSLKTADPARGVAARSSCGSS